MPDTPNATVVPGETTGTTPPFQGGTDPSAQINDQTKKILATLAQAMQRKQFAGHPHAAAVPGSADPNAARSIGMNTANPHAWGTQRFLGGLQTMLQNGIAKHKETEILRAEGDWEYMQAGLNELYAAQASGDKTAEESALKKLDAVIGDPKKRKNMAKALNQSWLDDKPPTPHAVALGRVTSKAQKTEAEKQQASQGLKGMFQRLMQRRQQPQISDEQRRQMTLDAVAKAPTSTPSIDTKQLHDAAIAIKDLRTAPEKYQFRTVKDADGSEKIVAVDQTDPTKPYVEVKSASGEKAKPGDKKYINDGKLEIVGGIPTGRVMHGGKYVAPGQSGYTKEDQEAVGLGLNAQGLSEKQKEKLTLLRGEAFARSRAQFTFHNVVDKETGEVGEVSAIDMAKNPGRYSGASEQEKISARDAVHESLNTNFAALDKSIDKLPNGLDTETQATIKAALRTENPGLIETLLVNKLKANAPDEVIQYLTNIKAMQEDVMTLRSVGGMGAGSDTMRNAMVNLIPGPGTSSIKEAKMQIQAAKRTSEALFSRRPQSKLPENTGEMETQTHNGATYQRKKGSKDPWTLSTAKKN